MPREINNQELGLLACECDSIHDLTYETEIVRGRVQD